MSAPQATCFIIMPITTPSAMAVSYGDSAHFLHVLEHLFIPAIEKAGFDAIPPIAKGSTLIHAEIVNRLIRADLVLCDMSLLNPNVFFELGIRTALNKPVALVKDQLTTSVPFDLASLAHCEYTSSLQPWELTGNIDKIAAHLRDTAINSANRNSLWQALALSASAMAPEAPLHFGLEAIKAELRDIRDVVAMSLRPKDNLELRAATPDGMWLYDEFQHLAALSGCTVQLKEAKGNLIRITTQNHQQMSKDLRKQLTSLAASHGYSLNIETRS